MMAHFTREFFRFLKDLDANNDRDWFQANKPRYERHLKEPALRFVVDFGPHLARISPFFRADPRPAGGSLFRIHRDVRFGRDKRPYKTHCGIQFRHRAGKDAHAPGYYLHLEPGGCFVAMGCWRPDNPALKKIRDAVAAEPAAWTRALSGKKFKDRFELTGDSLKRPPRGYDPEHPLVEDLKRKDFIAWRPLTQGEALAPDFLVEFAGACRAGTPLMKFLCEALGVDFQAIPPARRR